MTWAGGGAISAVIERLHARLANVAERATAPAVPAEPRVLVPEAPSSSEPRDEPAEPILSPGKGECPEEDHDWTLRDGSWQCKVCGASSDWDGHVPENPDVEAAIEPLAPLPALVCPVCREETHEPLRRFRSYELCARCYRTLTGKKYQQDPKVAGATSREPASQRGVAEGEPSRPVQPHPKSPRTYPVDELRNLRRAFETMCHKVWDRRTGRNSWGTDRLLLVDLIHRAASETVRLVDAAILDGSEIRALDWIRAVAIGPGVARAQEKERLSGLPELPSELAKACMHVTHRVRANAGSKDRKCVRLLDRSLEGLVGAAFARLRDEDRSERWFDVGSGE